MIKIVRRKKRTNNECLKHRFNIILLEWCLTRLYVGFWELHHSKTRSRARASNARRLSPSFFTESSPFTAVCSPLRCSAMTGAVRGLTPFVFSVGSVLCLGFLAFRELPRFSRCVGWCSAVRDGCQLVVLVRLSEGISCLSTASEIDRGLCLPSVTHLDRQMLFGDLLLLPRVISSGVWVARWCSAAIVSLLRFKGLTFLISIGNSAAEGAAFPVVWVASSTVLALEDAAEPDGRNLCLHLAASLRPTEMLALEWCFGGCDGVPPLCLRWLSMLLRCNSCWILDHSCFSLLDRFSGFGFGLVHLGTSVIDSAWRFWMVASLCLTFAWGQQLVGWGVVVVACQAWQIVMVASFVLLSGCRDFARWWYCGLRWRLFPSPFALFSGSSWLATLL